MSKNFRQAASALMIVAVLVMLAAPATAAPRAEPFSESTVPGLRLVTELWAWAGSWIGELPIESVGAPGGGLVDPDGEPATTSSPAPGPGGTERAGEDSTHEGT